MRQIELSNRLIWFQHFHKAAGSSIVEAAIENGEKLWPHHQNGNPADPAGEQIPLWKFTPEQLDEFIEQCEHLGVTFIATEWGLPDIASLASRTNLHFVTVIRDPLSRFVSNFYYDLHNGYTRARLLEHYVNSRSRTITMDNYYCRILSRINNRKSPVTESDYLAALSNLRHFVVIEKLENGIQKIANYLDWQTEIEHRNINKLKLRSVVGRLRSGQIELAMLELLKPKKSPSTEFEKQFRDDNIWDFRLFDSLV